MKFIKQDYERTTKRRKLDPEKSRIESAIRWKRHVATNPDHKQKTSEKNRLWHLKNKDKFNLRKKLKRRAAVAVAKAEKAKAAKQTA